MVSICKINSITVTIAQINEEWNLKKLWLAIIEPDKHNGDGTRTGFSAQ